ncbi:MAG: START-like domain-containing protein [Bacteroidetes bacterium]|nr:START-like domain-containing protein [Bacteroidota bacterium]MDA1335919.1 START-like domain-containing protein [Bacteroidota bacterium]
MMEKVRFQIEFPINSSKGVLFNIFSTPSGLSEWFCDDVNIKKDVHIFMWDGSEESARLITKKRDEFVKFRWLEDEEEGTSNFFEFRIKIDDLTGDTALVITDFAEEDEIEDSKELWSAQVDRLKQVLGA